MKLRFGIMLAACAVGQRQAAAQEIQGSAETPIYAEAALPVAPASVEGACWTESSGPRAWFGFDYLGWWAKGDKLPPLVSGSPAGTPRLAAGVLGQPNTTTLFGDRTVFDGYRTGLRLYGGWWFGCERKWAAEAGAFTLLQSSYGWSSPTDPATIVARPFLNVATGQQDAQLVNFPSVLAGGVTVTGATQTYGAFAGVRKNLWRCETPGCGCCPDGSRLDLLAGYRFLQIDDRLEIAENLVAGLRQTAVPTDTTLALEDHFRTLNTYHGGYLGFAWERSSNCWFAAATVRLGLGENCVRTTIDGVTTTRTPTDTPLTRPGGLLAQPTNMGTHTACRTAFLPEVGVKAGRQIGEHLRLHVGYDFLLLTNVSRIGDVVDLGVNPTQVPPSLLSGAARPTYAPSSSNYWLQGWSLGAELRF